MEDVRKYLEKLRVQIAECEMIRDLATDPKKRDLFGRLAEHHKVLVQEIESAIAEVQGSQSNEAKRYRDKAAEAQQLAKVAETNSRREALTHIASSYLRTAEHLEGLAKADRILQTKDQSKK